MLSVFFILAATADPTVHTKRALPPGGQPTSGLIVCEAQRLASVLRPAVMVAKADSAACRLVRALDAVALEAAAGREAEATDGCVRALLGLLNEPLAAGECATTSS